MILIFPLMIGTTEIVLLAGVALLLFGGKKLPEMMRNMGKGVKEFKEGVQGAPKEFEAGMNNEKEKTSEGQEPVDHVETREDEIKNEQ